MSVAMICSRSSSTAVVSFPPEKKEVLGSINLLVKNVDECPPPPGELIDIWSSIQAHKKQAKQPNVVDEEPYVHPLTRRSSSGLMSQKSLEICTESLGSETGSSEVDDLDHSIFSTTRCPIKQQAVEEEEDDDDDVVDVEHDEVAGVKKQRKEQQGAAVNYHCSISSSSRRTSPGRAFPPPLPSISCRDGPCVQMRPHRKDGRLVVKAVAVPSQNYLHAQRQGGRLLLSFINTTPPKRSIINTATNLTPEQTQEEVLAEEQDAESMELEDQEEEEEEEEEEVEVVDRGTVVEVKVSTQPQQQSGGGRGSAAMKVHRSSIVINKFVSCTYSLSSQDKELNIINNSDDDHAISTASGPRRSTAASTTTAAAAAVAASSLGTLPADGNHPSGFDNKLLFTTSKRSNREELLRDMRRCSQLRKPLFIWEPCCIATSS